MKLKAFQLKSKFKSLQFLQKADISENTDNPNNKYSERFKHDFQYTTRPQKMNIQTNTADGEENKLQQSIYKNEIQRAMMESKKQINKDIKTNKFLKHD